MSYKSITVDDKEYAYRFVANKYCVTLHVHTNPDDLLNSTLWKIPVSDKDKDEIPRYIREVITN